MFSWRSLLLIVLALIDVVVGFSQKPFADDSTHPVTKNLPDITVVGRYSRSDFQLMPEIVGTNIYAGKKSALIVLDNVQGNVVSNTMRQVLAKVPGIHVWESDPSGIQIGIAARGLSPNRSWEFNIRQNGYDIAADPFGYPEAYYNPQLQAVQRIEVVRGHGALQYGPQFGGLVNYILRNGSEIDQKLVVETQQTVGSNNLFNTYNAVGGKNGRSHYYAFFDHRNGNGWRNNSRFYTNAVFGTYTYKLAQRLNLSAEIMHSQIRSQQPGGLTDEQFKQDPRQSLRSRNWFNIQWTTPALILNYTINEATRWNTKLFATIGDRSSIGFLQTITVADSINPATLQYNNRTAQVDHYRNYGLESRFITDYKMGRWQNTLSTGIRLYTGTTHRLSNGKGSNGTAYSMVIEGEYPGDIKFRSANAAAFAENIFRVTDQLLIIPGIRLEWLEGEASGRTGFNNLGNPILLQPITRGRTFILGGIGAEWHVGTQMEIYGNISQAYRPIQFANLQAPPTTDVVDPNLKDAKGYNADLGYRGKYKDFLQFDVSLFFLQYNNRIGTVTVSGTPSYRLITNVGNSTSKGMESYIEFNPLRAWVKGKTDLMLFASYGYTNARYDNDHKDANTKGKKVENAPEHILRSGMTFGWKTFSATLQWSYSSETYSDANNTETPSANGNTGLIPAYSVTDLTFAYKIKPAISVKGGINNLGNTYYFTRRAGGYPGPGLLPADGRTLFLSLAAKL
ncbi:MAG: hypothetical protein B7Z54_00295 [Sphingobacteriales bacterium 12-47-4]|nr:MAG: hypothetical protein B7Z54_00295 [Sphingobacteriales bacterium 12-47-4]